MFIRAQVVEHTQSPFDFGFPQQQRGEATGSGFVVDRNGTILTNAHVVAGATKVTVQFADKHVVEAKILGRDESTDLAVLKVDAEGERAHAARRSARRSDVQVGDPTIAIGNPFGLERTLTTGVVSAHAAARSRRPNGFEIDDVIQTDAAINPGNSGGPLLDAAGRVIGINSQIETGGSGGGNVGIGFAIPIDTRQAAAPELEKNGRVDRGFLGVDSLTDRRVAAATSTSRSSTACSSRPSRPGSPAAKAGIRGGDIVAHARRQPDPPRRRHHHRGRRQGRSARSDDLADAIARQASTGDKVKIDVVRDGKKRTVEVTLASARADADLRRTRLARTMQA